MYIQILDSRNDFVATVQICVCCGYKKTVIIGENEECLYVFMLFAHLFMAMRVHIQKHKNLVIIQFVASNFPPLFGL